MKSKYDWYPQRLTSTWGFGTVWGLEGAGIGLAEAMGFSVMQKNKVSTKFYETLRS